MNEEWEEERRRKSTLILPRLLWALKVSEAANICARWLTPARPAYGAYALVAHGAGHVAPMALSHTQWEWVGKSASRSQKKTKSGLIVWTCAQNQA